MKKTWTIVLIISLAFNIGIASIIGYRVFERKKWAKNRRPQGILRSFMQGKAKGLSKGQVKEIDGIFKKTQKGMRPLQKELAVKRKELFEMVKAGKIDTAREEKLLEEISGLQVEMEKKMFNNIVNIRGRMTPEQRANFDKMLDSCKPSDEGFPESEGLRVPPGRGFRGRGKPPFHF